MNNLLQTLLQQAVQNFQSGNLTQSHTILNNILQIDPKNFHAIHLMGVIYGIQDNHECAVNFFQKAVKINPNDYSANFNLAKALAKTGNHSVAIKFHNTAVRLAPEQPEAWLNYGKSLSDIHNFEDAITHYDQAIKLNSQYADAWYNKGVALQELKRYEEAIVHYDEVIKLLPTHAKAWHNKGVCLHDLRLYDQAILNYDEAIKLEPEYAEAWCNKGASSHEAMSLENALTYYERALQIDPNYLETYWNKAITSLTLGDYKNGWELYEYRWKTIMSKSYRHGEIPALTSLDNLHNKKILVWHEQGYGDTIQFSRYISAITNLGAKVTFEVQEPLINLLQNSIDYCKVTQLAHEQSEFDYQIPLLSLPRLLKFDLNKVPKPIQISLDSTYTEKWKSQLNLSDKKPNIGVAISGNPSHKNDLNRSMPLKELSKIFGYGNFFIIQKNLNPEDQALATELNNIFFLGNLINDFTDTAAIIANMDMIISVDTSLIHLAGSMNKKSFLLLPFCPDWRWLTNAPSSLWYESIKVIRQNKFQDWNSVVDEVKLDLIAIKK